MSVLSFFKKLDRDDRVVLTGLFAVVLIAPLAALYPASFLFLLVLLGAVIILFLLSDPWKLFFLGLLFPFQGLRLIMSPPRGSFLLAFFPDGIDQSLGNIIGLLLLTFIVFRIVRAVMRQERITLSLPFIGVAALFWFSGFLSVINAEESKLLSLKYVLYPIVFSYCIYVLVPSTLIKSRQHLRKIVEGMALAGFLAALMGIISLFRPEGALAGRATTISFFGLWPLGMNHNLLAEALVATVPLVAFLLLGEENRRRRLFFSIALFLMILVALLTFARTAWIVFVVMLGALMIAEQKKIITRYWKQGVIILFGVLPLAVLFAFFSQSRVVEGSTAARLRLTDFSVFLLSQHPLLGAGAGTFVERLGNTQDFLQDFGDPLDAHGFGQKILAEQGIVGILAFLFLLGRIIFFFLREIQAFPAHSKERRELLFFACSACGMMLYEVFNTTYYSAKLWLPMGVSLAALSLLTRKKIPTI